MTKLIKIVCKTTNTIEIYKYKVKIYDEDNNLIINRYTNKGCIYFDAKINTVYKIIIIPSFSLRPKKICNFFIVNNSFNTLFFYFEPSFNLVKIYLVDKNYKNLKIMRGEIILWQRNM